MGEIVDQSKFKAIEADKLVKAAWNYKTDNAELGAKLVENIKRNGQIENIIVRQLETGFYEVVNGNHRLDALKTIGAKRVMCYDLGKVTAQEAYRVAIETNETKFSTDVVKLGGLISEIASGSSVDELIASMPYSAQEMENFIGMASFDFDKYKEEEATEPGADIGSGQHRISFVATAEIKAAWEEWQARCNKLFPKLGSDEAAFLKALAAALDHTEDFAPGEAD
jgi:hypothetical protein